MNIDETASRKMGVPESLPCTGKKEYPLELVFGGELGSTQSER